MGGMGDSRRLVGRIVFVVVGRENLCKGISNLDASVETDTLINCAIESH